MAALALRCIRQAQSGGHAKLAGASLIFAIDLDAVHKTDGNPHRLTED